MGDLMLAVLYGKTASDNAARLRAYLRTDWELACVDEGDLARLRAVLPRAVALIALGFDRELTPWGGRLRLVQSLGAGVDAFEIEALPAGCTLCNVYEHEVPVAEYVMGAILQLAIRFDRHDALLRMGRWAGTGRRDGHVHMEVSGKRLGLLGYGHIGREVARRARAFGMPVHAVRRQPHAPLPGELVPDWIGGMSQLPALLQAADFLVIACPLTAETRGLIGVAELASLRPSAYVINVARAEVIEEQALHEALKERRIAGAVLDVWYQYPGSADEVKLPSRFPFHELDNVILTPHLSAWTAPMQERRWRRIAENLDRLADGRPLLNAVASAGRQ